MGKGFNHVYKPIKLNCPYPSHNITFIVPSRSFSRSQHDITNDYGVIVISLKQLSPISNLTTTTQVDTDSNNDDDTQYFITPRKHNKITPGIPETTATNTPVQSTVHFRLSQISSST